MEFLGTSFFVLLILIALNVYFIHLYYKLEQRLNDNTHFIIDLMKRELQQLTIPKSNNESKRIYYASPSSLIEVSSDDNTINDSDCEYDDGDDDDNYISDECNIKNVHMSLNLENLEDIHVLLLDEIANINEINSEKRDYSEEKKQECEEIKCEEVKECLEEINEFVEEMKGGEMKGGEMKECAEEINECVEEMKGGEMKGGEMKECAEEIKCEEIKEYPEEMKYEEIVELSDPKELTFKSKKRESRKNISSSNDYRKMNLTDLRKYVMENNINLPDVSKMKKPEILKAIEELKNNELFIDKNETLVDTNDLQ